MKRVLAALALVAVVFGSACTGGRPGTPSEGAGATTGTPEPSRSFAAEGLEAIPAEGAGESEALAAVPGALPSARAMRESAGALWPDLDGFEPVLVAYLVRADLGDQAALFEVRADGIAHNIHAYHKAFDSGSIIWMAADDAPEGSAAPRGDRERAAVGAVAAAMADAFPGEHIACSVSGYRFAFVRDDTLALVLEIAPDGTVVSVGE